MSLTKKMVQLEEANAASVEKIAELEASIIEKDAAIESLGSDHEAKVSELSAKVEELETASASHSEELEKVQSERDEIAGKLEAAEHQLTAPAYQAAKAEGEEEPAETGEQEPEAVVEPKEAAQKTIDEYSALEEGVERSRFIAARGAELQDAYNLLNQEG